MSKFYQIITIITDPDQVRECMQAKQRKMFNLEKKYMDMLQAKHAHVRKIYHCAQYAAVI